MYLRCTVATSTVGPRWAVHEFIYILRWRVDQKEGGTERVKNFSERMMWGGAGACWQSCCRRCRRCCRAAGPSHLVSSNMYSMSCCVRLKGSKIKKLGISISFVFPPLFGGPLRVRPPPHSYPQVQGLWYIYGRE